MFSTNKNRKIGMLIFLFVVSFIVGMLINIQRLGSLPMKLIQVEWNDTVGCCLLYTSELDALKQEEAEMESADVNEASDDERVAERKTLIEETDKIMNAQRNACLLYTSRCV